MQNREYWVNVYERNIFGATCTARWVAIRIMQKDVLYRIHVKLKPVKSKQPKVTIYSERGKFDWMG